MWRVSARLPGSMSWLRWRSVFPARARSLHSRIPSGPGVRATSARSLLRAANTPAYRTKWRRGGGTSAARLPESSSGVKKMRFCPRLAAHGVPQSPTDHVFSMATYIHDPDGLMVELTLETPERFGRFEITDAPSGAARLTVLPLAEPAGQLDELERQAIERALAEIEAHRGTHYDAAACEACLRLFREKGYRLPD